ncbi:MAG: L-rhamnose/proton symporter RhaT [Terracidiphilus sp.]
MGNMLLAGALLAVFSGLLNGTFTLPMRFLGRWEWENVWILFVVVSCILMPATVISVNAPGSWNALLQAPVGAVLIALATGFAWGFGSVLFGQSVSAIGISLANTLVLAISSALGSILPILFLSPGEMLRPSGGKILGAVAVELLGMACCGWAGRMRECAAGIDSERGDMVGHARSIGIALLMVTGAGILSAVQNIGFSMAHPISDCARARGLSDFAGKNLIWFLMLGAGSIANLGFCFYLMRKNHSARKFIQPGVVRLLGLASLMGLLWGASIFVYGAAAPRLGSLGTSIGWPLSLSVGLLVANSIGIGLGEWRGAPRRARFWLYLGIAILLVAVVMLGLAGR